jgi:hypothetical protein
MQGAHEKKARCLAGLNPILFEESWRRQVYYAAWHHLIPIYLSHTGYSRSIYLVKTERYRRQQAAASLLVQEIIVLQPAPATETVLAWSLAVPR